MFLDEIGIYGWGPIEPLILSAILADLSVLLIGDIGTNKTEEFCFSVRLFNFGL